MLTNAKVAELFNIEENNISAYSDKKTANLRWEMVNGKFELRQERFIIVHLKQVQWSSNIRDVGTSKLQLSTWETVPYVIPVKEEDGCIIYE